MKKSEPYSAEFLVLVRSTKEAEYTSKYKTDSYTKAVKTKARLKNQNDYQNVIITKVV